jgi:UDP-glucose 4-epimerase
VKIAVIGTGLIGSQVANDLNEAGHEAAGYSRSTGIDILTGAGLDQAMDGAQVVVDVTNSPTFDDASIEFFRTSVPHLLNAAQSAGVRHFVTLSTVGADKVPDLAYYRAKTLQTVMLLLRAEGLHSCTQMAWAKAHRTVAEIVRPPEELVLFCGVSIGYEDATVNLGRTPRAPFDETVSFV